MSLNWTYVFIGYAKMKLNNHLLSCSFSYKASLKKNSTFLSKLLFESFCRYKKFYINFRPTVIKHTETQTVYPGKKLRQWYERKKEKNRKKYGKPF
jgi:hypothetical protein